MNLLTIVNATANVIVAIAVTDLALRVFGRPDHPIHKRPLMLFTRKLVSSIVICGAVLNVATLSTPSWTEVLLNVGFSLSYIWSSYYDRTSSTKHSASAAKIPRERASSGARNSGDSASNSSPSRNGRKRASS